MPQQQEGQKKYEYYANYVHMQRFDREKYVFQFRHMFSLPKPLSAFTDSIFQKYAVFNPQTSDYRVTARENSWIIH
jgi:hypothetical protein